MKIVLKRKFWFIKIIILSVGLLTIFSCKKKEENPPEETPIVQNRVFVVNEGLFQQGNASLIIYDKKNQGLYIDVYQKENGIGLGDIFQSMITKNGKGFFVINNSNKICI